MRLEHLLSGDTLKRDVDKKKSQDKEFESLDRASWIWLLVYSFVYIIREKKEMRFKRGAFRKTVL